MSGRARPPPAAPASHRAWTDTSPCRRGPRRPRTRRRAQGRVGAPAPGPGVRGGRMSGEPGGWARRRSGRDAGELRHGGGSGGPTPSERARPLPGFKRGPRSAPRGRRPQRTGPVDPPACRTSPGPEAAREPSGMRGGGCQMGTWRNGTCQHEALGQAAVRVGRDCSGPAVPCGLFWGQLPTTHQAISGRDPPF